MTEQEKKRTEEKRNTLALHTVQTALDNGFSMYDIEKLAAGIVCLAKPVGLNKCRWKEAEKLQEAAINIKHRGKRNMDNYDYEIIGYVVKWRGTNGKTHRRGGFGTVEEAAEFAKEKLETEDEVSVTQKRGVIGWWK